MFAVGRKRPREEVEDEGRGVDEKLPLEGIIACLSGFDQGRKEDLHQLILDLGGRYTRELNLDKNTHLITDTASGAKFQLASSSNPPVIHIVTSSWVNSTAESGQKACEKDHNLRYTTIHNSTTSLGYRSTLSLASDAMSDEKLSFLFQKQQFYLIGFEENTELQQKIGKLIRRGNGTIHWNMNEDITVLLVCDGCDDALRKAAAIISSHHINLPPMVSPLWVIDSYKRGALQSTKTYPPIETSNSNNNRIQPATKKQKTVSTTSNVSIFRGCLFALVQSSSRDNPLISETTTTIEFDESALEALIKKHGGQILSNKLLGALRADSITSKRKCHVVCWGEFPLRLSTNPLVSQIQRHNLCELVLVTPIWLHACVSARKRIQQGRMPLILQPQSWPMLSIQNKLEIALTGFQGTEKLVVVHWIQAMGGVYHENMSRANTHLVVKKHPNGLKLKKAREWGLHVVSIRWLYHILKHGYGGEHNEKGGCEERFSFRVESRSWGVPITTT